VMSERTPRGPARLALCGAGLALAIQAAGCSDQGGIDPSIQFVGPPAGDVKEPPRPKFKKGVPQGPTGIQRRRNPGAE